MATTAQFMTIPMMLKAATAIATLPARFAHYCANAEALATGPLPFPSPTFGLNGVAQARCRLAVHRLAALPYPRRGRRGPESVSSRRNDSAPLTDSPGVAGEQHLP